MSEIEPSALFKQCLDRRMADMKILKLRLVHGRVKAHLAASRRGILGATA